MVGRGAETGKGLIMKKYTFASLVFILSICSLKGQTSIGQIFPHNNYAVIINGGGNIGNNHITYWNDCSAYYKTLTQFYGYKAENIYVLISDGLNASNDRTLGNGQIDSSPWDLDGNGTNDIQYAATKANLSAVFTDLSKKITNQNDLFVYLTGPGGYDSIKGSFLVLWNEEFLFPEDFAKEIDKINASHITTIISTSHSGGFLSKLDGPSNRIIMTSCLELQSAERLTNNSLFDSYWISAVNRTTPIQNDKYFIDRDRNGFISMNEAFLYTKIYGYGSTKAVPLISGPASSVSLFGGIPVGTTLLRGGTITTNDSFKNKHIILKDITITNGAKLTLDADTISIYDIFRVDNNSEVEFK